MFCYISLKRKKNKKTQGISYPSGPFARIALVFVRFMKNPTNSTFFGSLIIPENDFIFKKRQKFNTFGKWEGFFTHTCLHRLGSTPSRNKENKTVNTAFSQCSRLTFQLSSQVASERFDFTSQNKCSLARLFCIISYCVQYV